MRILTLNLNGIRSAARKGFFDWVKTQNADVICVQELKAQKDDMQLLNLEGYHAIFIMRKKKDIAVLAFIHAKNLLTWS